MAYQQAKTVYSQHIEGTLTSILILHVDDTYPEVGLVIHLIVLLLDFPSDSYNLHAHHWCVKNTEHQKYLFTIPCWHNSVSISRRRTFDPSSTPLIALNWEWTKCCIISKTTKQTVEKCMRMFHDIYLGSNIRLNFKNTDEEKWNKCDDTNLQNLCTAK